MKYITTIFVLALLLFSCEKDDTGNKNTLVKIYINNDDLDFKSLSIKEEEDGYFIFGIAGNSPETKFDEVKNLYFLKTDKNGKYEWGETFSVDNSDGFPSNLIKVNDKYYTFWNDIDGKKTSLLSIEKVGTNYEITIVNEINFNERYSANYVMYAQDNFEQNGFAVLVLSTENSGGIIYTSRLIETTDQAQITSVKGEYNYIPTKLGSKDLSELLPNIDNHTFFVKDENSKRYCLNTPYDNTMALIFAGDNVPVFNDNDYWVAAISDITENKINAIVSTPNLFNQDAFYISDIELYPIEKKFASLSSNANQISNIDIKHKIFISANLIIGTSTSSKYVEYKVNDYYNPLYIGNVYPYEITGVKFGDNQVTIVGNTALKKGDNNDSNEKMRIFLIRKDVY